MLAANDAAMNGPPVPVVAPHVAGPVAPPVVDANPGNVQHGQQAPVSRADSLRYLQTIVKDHIFPRIIFPNPDEDLSFSNDPRSICRQMVTLASVADVDIKAWWNLTRKGVFESIKRLKNNSIRLLGIAVKGNFVVSWCCSLRLHIVFSNTNFLSPRSSTEYVSKNSSGYDYNLELISGLRGVESWTEYKAILDKTLQCIVLAHRYKKNRLTEPLCQWFTFTNEAFLLVCFESYRRKWSYKYTQEFGTQAEKAALPAEAPGLMYSTAGRFARDKTRLDACGHRKIQSTHDQGGTGLPSQCTTG